MPNTAAQVGTALGALTGPSINEAVRSRLFRNRDWRPVLVAMQSGRPVPAGTVLPLVGADGTATAAALRLVADMTAAEARKLPATLFKGASGRAFWYRLNGRGAQTAISYTEPPQS